MRCLIPLLFVTLTFISCGTQTEIEEVFEPYQIGTWIIQSETNAEWVGTNAKAFSQESDTTFISNPERHSINIEANESDLWTNIVIVDSLDFSFPEYRLQFTIPYGDDIGTGGQSSNIYEDYRVSIIELGGQCNARFDGDQYIYASFYEDITEDPIHVFQFDINGFVEAFKEIHCVTQ